MRARFTVGRRVWLQVGPQWFAGSIIERTRTALTAETYQQQRVYVSHAVASKFIRVSNPAKGGTA
jgi:hypothetical protein